MKKNEVYHLVTVDNGMTDTASILRVFSKMTTGSLTSDIKLLNYYHEVPVNYGATISSIDKDSVELSVHENQAVVIKHDNSTLIKSMHFPKDLAVHCYAAYVNPSKKIVVLHSFAYAQIRAERRESVRVSVTQPIQVVFTHESIRIVGTMVDISGTGISVCTDVNPEINTNQMVQLTFSLMGSPLTVQGTFIRTLTDVSDQHVCIFQIKSGMKSDTIIGKFIYQRQIEIINELKDGLVTD